MPDPERITFEEALRRGMRQPTATSAPARLTLEEANRLQAEMPQPEPMPPPLAMDPVSFDDERTLGSGDPIQRRFIEAVSGLPPQQQQNVVSAQNANRFYDPTGDSSVTERTVAEFVSPVLDIVGGVPARIFGVDQPTLAESYPPPESRGEAIARGAAGILGEGASFVVPSGPLAAARFAGRAAAPLGKIAQYGAGVVGFTAPSQLGEVVSGEQQLGQAAIDTAISPFTLPVDVARAATVGAYKTAKAVADPSASPEATQAAFDELRPAAALALAHSLRPKPAAKEVRNDAQVAVPASQEGPVRRVAEPVADPQRQAGVAETVMPQETSNESVAKAETRQGQAQKGQGLLIEKVVAETPETQSGESRAASIIDRIADAPGTKKQASGGRQITDLVANEPGPAATIIGRRSRRATETAKVIRGVVEPLRKDYIKTFRGQKAVRSELSELVPVQEAPGMFKSKMQQLLDNRATAEVQADPSVSPEAKAAALKYADITQKTLQEARQRGADIVYDPKTGQSVRMTGEFTTNKFIRSFTPQGAKIWFQDEAPNQGPGSTLLRMKNTLLQGLAKMNNMELAEAKEKARNIITIGDQTRTVGPLEVLRVFKNFPAAMEFEGKTIKLLETDPVVALDRGLAHLPERAGYVIEFERGGRGKQLQEAYLKQGGNPNKLDRLIRSLNDQPYYTDEVIGKATRAVSPPGGLMEKVFEATGLVGSVAKAGLLSAAFVPQLVEPIAKIPSMAGTGRMLRGYAELLKSPLKKTAETRRWGEQIGAITATVYDFSHPRKLEGLAKAISEGAGPNILFKWSNEFNETATSLVGRMFADDLKSGRTSPNDVARLRALRFTESEAKNMMQGKASQELYDSIPRRLVRFSQGENMARSERLTLAGSRLFPVFMPFQRFGEITLDQLITQARNLRNTIADPKASGAEKAGAFKQVAKYLVGAQAAGALGTLLTSIYFGRSTDRSDESWLKYIGWNFLQAGLGQQLTPLYYAANRSDSYGLDSMMNTIVGMNPTASLFLTTSRMFGSEKEFRDLTMTEKVWKLIEKQVPIVRGHNGYLVLTGQAADPELKKVEKKILEWKSDKGYLDQTTKAGFDAFRRARNKLKAAVERGDYEEATAWLAEMMTAAREKNNQIEPRMSVDQSLRNILLLTGKNGSSLTGEERAEVQKIIGERGMRIAEARDKSLLSVTKDNLGVAGQYYMTIRDLRANVKDKNAPRRAVAEKFNQQINRLLYARDKESDPAKKKKLMDSAARLMQSAMKQMGESNPVQTDIHNDIDAEIKAILKEQD